MTDKPKEKPCLPYTGQFKINIERTAEVYPRDRGFVTVGAKSNEIWGTPPKQRFDLGEK